MSLAEVGLYIMCLNRSWRYGSLPDDAEEVSLLIRKKVVEVKKCWPKVRECYLDRGDGRLVNRKQEEIREEVAEKSAKARSAVKARWDKKRTSETDTNADTDVLRTNGQRKSDVLLRAFASASSSNSSSEVPEIESAGNFPNFEAHVLEIFPDSSSGLLRLIAEECVRVYPPITDDELVCAARAATKPKQFSAALYKTTMPEVIRTWASKSQRDSAA